MTLSCLQKTGTPTTLDYIIAKSQHLTSIHLNNYLASDSTYVKIPSPRKMNPLDLLLLRNGSKARQRAESSHAISTNHNEMMDQLPKNNPKPRQIGTMLSHLKSFQVVLTNRASQVQVSIFAMCASR